VSIEERREQTQRPAVLQFAGRPTMEPTPAPLTFLLSPAHAGGARAALLLRKEAAFPLALRLRSVDGVPIGELYAFMSGLYFRGKLAYANAFARPPEAVCVIVPGRGLLSPATPVTRDELDVIARVPVDLDHPGYRDALGRASAQLAAGLAGDARVVLLGSIATDKYLSVLTAAFGDRLRFPAEFVGRGDMSRGGLLLRQVAAQRELAYVRIDEVVRRGARPPKLPPLVRTAATS
jgi:hypothetical protein